MLFVNTLSKFLLRLAERFQRINAPIVTRVERWATVSYGRAILRHNQNAHINTLGENKSSGKGRNRDSTTRNHRDTTMTQINPRVGAKGDITRSHAPGVREGLECV